MYISKRAILIDFTNEQEALDSIDPFMHSIKNFYLNLLEYTGPLALNGPPFNDITRDFKHFISIFKSLKMYMSNKEKNYVMTGFEYTEDLINQIKNDRKLLMRFESPHFEN